MKLYAVDPGKRRPALVVFADDGSIDHVRIFEQFPEDEENRSDCAFQIARRIVTHCFPPSIEIHDRIALSLEGPNLSKWMFHPPRMVDGRMTNKSPRNPHTIEDLARVRQAIYQAFRNTAARRGLEFLYAEPAPATVKKVTGSGKAKKEAVVAWVREHYPAALRELGGVKWREQEVSDAVCVGLAGRVLLGFYR